jgi:uncharacterized membrane protein
VTNWAGETSFDSLPVAAYGVVLLLSGCAYYLLSRALVADHCADSALVAAIGTDVKGKVSILIYAAAIPLAFVQPLVSCALYVVVAVIWLVPDRRIENALAGREAAE